MVSPSIIPYHFYFVAPSILHQIGYDQFVHAVWYTYDFSFILLLSVLQGMSDLLSPILFVMEDESESFWCFVALMERLGPNFNRDQNGMHSQLFALSKVSHSLSHLLVSCFTYRTVCIICHLIFEIRFYILYFLFGLPFQMMTLIL